MIMGRLVDQKHTHTHTHTHIYIYIYIYIHRHTHDKFDQSVFMNFLLVASELQLLNYYNMNVVISKVTLTSEQNRY